MKIVVNKTGQNDKGIWIYGTADLGGFEITAIFGTNLKGELPKVNDSLSFKKIKLLVGKSKNVYQLEF